MSGDTDQYKRMEKEDITFTGMGGKIPFGEFDKFM
jgi:hypothetical protein